MRQPAEIAGNVPHLRPGANFEFLIALEAASTGTTPEGIRRIDTLPDYLEKLRKEPVRTAAVRTKLYPDWRRNADPLFLPALLVGFVVILGLEWGLRRLWGLV